MAETRGRMSRKDQYRLYELASLLEQPVATWTTPFQRAQEAMKLAGEAMEFQDAEAARYAVRVHLRYMRVLIEQFEREEAATRARESAQVQAMIGAALEDGALDFGGPKIPISIHSAPSEVVEIHGLRFRVDVGPHKPEPLHPGDLGVLREGPSGTEMGEQLIDVSLLKGFAPWPSEPRLSDVVRFGPSP